MAANRLIQADFWPGILMKMLLVSVLGAVSLAGCAAEQGGPEPPNYYIHQLSLEGGGG